MERIINNHKIVIERDEHPFNPRKDDNLSVMVCFHGKYKLGDDHEYRQSDYSSWQELKNAIIEDEDPVVIYPLYMYDHSGITISTKPFSCKWDSGQIGFVYIPKKRLEGDWISVENAEKVLLAEVETYDKYLVGDVWSYKIYKLNKCDQGHLHEEYVDSCWGFYDYEECLSQAEAEVDYK